MEQQGKRKLNHDCKPLGHAGTSTSHELAASVNRSGARSFLSATEHCLFPSYDIMQEEMLHRKTPPDFTNLL